MQEAVIVWRVFCRLQTRSFTRGEEQIESDWLSEYTAASGNPIRCEAASGTSICTNKLYQIYIKSKEEMIPWPAKLVDLIPTEWVREEFDRKVRKTTRKCGSSLATIAVS